MDDRDDKKLDKIENNLERVVERLSSIDATLSGQHESLKDHMRRTSLLEQKLEPIEAHVSMVQGALKFIALVSLLLGIFFQLGHLK